MSEALVLVGMSVREVEAGERLERLAADAEARIAFLQLGDPSLSRELDRLSDDGHDRVVLVGISLGSLAPANSWLRRIAGHWWRARTGHRPEIQVATALLKTTDGDELRDVLRQTRPISGNEASLQSPAWEEVPRHRHQILLCRGPRCTALGSDASAEAMIIALMTHEQGDDDVLLTYTGCQFPCNHAPVVSLQPDDVWYGDVTPDAARRIIEDHVVHGRPVAENRLSRRCGLAPDGV
jgi:(2Fe-2S) ferredoxin